MTLHDDIWRLPGPAGFVREVAAAAEGRNVAAVIPAALALDPAGGDALAAALVRAMPRSLRLFPTATDGPLTGALGAQVSFTDQPVTVRELLTHSDVIDRKLVILAADLEPAHLVELPHFLRRLETESRITPAAERAAFVIITDRSHLPNFPSVDGSEVALAAVWYWNRVSRWDVAALLAGQLGDMCFDGILGDVRLERAIELAKWNFELALKLATDWSGDAAEIGDLLGREPDTEVPTFRGHRRTSWPPEALRAAWDQRAVDMWHGAMTRAYSPQSSGGVGLERVLWRAQARVLLPWIELKRAALEHQVRERLGPERWHSAVTDSREHSPTARAANVPLGQTDDAVEISALKWIVGARLGRRENPRLGDTVAALHRARNDLAHLRPLPQARLQSLVSQCDWI